MPRLSIDIDPGLHERLRVAAARQGVTIREYCLNAIRRSLRQEPAEYLSWETAPELAKVWDNEEDAVYDQW